MNDQARIRLPSERSKLTKNSLDIKLPKKTRWVLLHDYDVLMSKSFESIIYITQHEKFKGN